MKKVLKNIFTYILAIIATISVNFNIGSEVVNFDRFGETSVIYIILFIFFLYILKRVLRIKQKRLIIMSLGVSIIFAIIEILGYSLSHDAQLMIPKSAIIKLIGYVILFYCAISILFTKFNIFLKQEKCKEENTINIKYFIVAWIGIFVLWIPYLIKYYPGIMTTDSIMQTGQAIAYGLNSHHPMFHTLFIKLCLEIGSKIKDYNLGVAIYSILQMLIMSGIFSYTVYYMKKRDVSKTIRIITLLFFALYPVFPMYAVTMWKDVLFGTLMLLYTINIVELVHDTESYTSSWKRILGFIIITLLVMLLRNNGIYAIILSAPIVLIVFRKYYKQIIIMFLIPIILYYCFNSFAYNVLKANKGNIAEALSVPMQQMARVAKYHKDELTEEQKNDIDEFIPVDKAAEVYDSKISDPVKNLFNSEKFKTDKIKFIKVWGSLFLDYPKEYIESFLYGSFGYWYPDVSNWIYATEIGENEFEIKQTKELNQIKLLDECIKIRNIPVVSMIFSVGFAFWIALTIIIYLIYIKKYKYIVCFATMIALWITTLASPVYCEYRYVFSIFTCLPIFISILQISNKKTIGDKNEK